jgi:hypothetical protein
MTWNKKLNSREYDPIAAVSITPSAGSISDEDVSSLVVTEAYYTVINDYICTFNLFVSFTQYAADASSYQIASPLGLSFVAANGPIGNGTFYISSHQSAWVEKDSTSSTLFRVYPLAGGTIAEDSEVQLRIIGQFAVR